MTLKQLLQSVRRKMVDGLVTESTLIKTVQEILVFSKLTTGIILTEEISPTALKILKLHTKYTQNKVTGQPGLRTTTEIIKNS